MKKIIVIVISLVSSFAGLAQNEQQKEAEIREMEVTEAQALLQKDIATLRKIWSPGFMVNAPLNAVFIGGQVELVAAGILSYTSFTRIVEHVLVLKDVVITMGSETVIPSGADPRTGETINRRYTNIWVKEKGNWVLQARHANDICPSLTGAASILPDARQMTTMPPTISIRNNPASTYFDLVFLKWAGEKISINIVDHAGRSIERLQVPNKNQRIRIGEHYRTGIYFAEITNGMDKRTVKLVKL